MSSGSKQKIGEEHELNKALVTKINNEQKHVQH